MKEVKTAITRFMLGEWYIDIIEDRDTFEAWLTHKSQGISTLMFGQSKEAPGKIEGTDTQEFEDFCELVEANAIEYMRVYLSKYMDIEICLED